jgi:hypothetical protein
MLALVVMRAVLRAASMLFGGLGIFFLYYSYSDPILSTYGLIFIGSASGIVWSTGG